MVTSPGWRPDSPLLVSAAEAGVEVVGEPELAWRLRVPLAGGEPAPWYAVTGTNGKTTTVTMLEALLLAGGRRAVAAGNVGRPLVEVVTAVDDEGAPAFDAVAVELSSFQLHWSSSLAPAAAAVLNVADDHVDWHGSPQAYRDAKAKVLERAPVAVADAGDPVAAALVRAHRHPVTVTTGEPAAGQLGVRSGVLVDRAFADDPAGEVLLAADPLQVAGPHNVVNALVAAALARVAGVSGGRHRYRAGRLPRRGAPQRAGGHGRTAWTSSTTPRRPTRTPRRPRWPPTPGWSGSPAACSRAPTSTRWSPRWRRGWPASCCWAATGRCWPGRWRDTPPSVPRIVVPSGDDVGVAGVTSGTGEAVMVQVVRAAAELARPGDTVLLAPAAASMDVFTDYGHRGRAFTDAVRALR